MTENKRFIIEFDGHRYFLVIDNENERCLARLDTRMDALAWLEIYKMLSYENEQLKKENEFLKKRCNEYWEESGLNSDYFEWGKIYEVLEKRIQL